MLTPFQGRTWPRPGKECRLSQVVKVLIYIRDHADLMKASTKSLVQFLLWLFVFDGPFL